VFTTPALYLYHQPRNVIRISDIGLISQNNHDILAHPKRLRYDDKKKIKNRKSVKKRKK